MKRPTINEFKRMGDYVQALNEYINELEAKLSDHLVDTNKMVPAKCHDCGNEMQEVRPGKWQCNHCEANPSPDSECDGCKHQGTYDVYCDSCDDITDNWEPKEPEKSCDGCKDEYTTDWRHTCKDCINHDHYTPAPKSEEVLPPPSGQTWVCVECPHYKGNRCQSDEGRCKHTLYPITAESVLAEVTGLDTGQILRLGKFLIIKVNEAIVAMEKYKQLNK